jgi:hypothetical protein
MSKWNVVAPPASQPQELVGGPPVPLAVDLGPAPSLPEHFITVTGEPDRPKLLQAINAFYDVVDPTREPDRREGLVASILFTGWDAVNEAMRGKYGKDLSIVEGDFMTDHELRTLVNEYYNKVDPTRPTEAREAVVPLIREQGWRVVNERMQVKYKSDLASILSSRRQQSSKGAESANETAVVSRTNATQGAPTQQSVMTTGTILVAPSFSGGGAFGFKTYHVQKQTFLSLVTCGGVPMCTVIDTSNQSKFTFGLGCFELPCAVDGKSVGKLVMMAADNGPCGCGGVKVPTMVNENHEIVARCYLADTVVDCCGANLVFLLDITGYQVLKARVEPCNFGRFTFYDVAGQVALEVDDGVCCSQPVIRAREDIPFYAVAIVPWKTANQKQG